MPNLQERLRATGGDLDAMFDLLIPGRSPAAVRLRRDAVALCRDSGARGALLLGPPGSGKSTLARALALGRYLHLLTPDRAREVLTGIRVDPPARFNKLSMNWYEEVSLTGLVTELADTQLFGIVAGAATGVGARAGIFRQAQMGHAREASDAARITGGVVFLDEIGDLPGSLQPKLLTVLTGADVAPVGGESNPDEQYRFEGLTLAATWKDPFADDLLRRDLVSRLADHVLHIPSLAERKPDLDLIVEAVVSELKSSGSAWLTARASLRAVGLDTERAAARLANLADFAVTGADLDAIRAADWDEYGDLRGMAQVLRRCVEQGIGVSESLERQLRIPTKKGPLSDTDAKDIVFRRILATQPGGRGLPGVLQAVEHAIREELVEELRADRAKLVALAGHLGVEERELRRRLTDVSRNRGDR